MDDGVYAQGDIDLFATPEEIADAGPHFKVKAAGGGAPTLAEQLQANKLVEKKEVKQIVQEKPKFNNPMEEMMWLNE